MAEGFVGLLPLIGISGDIPKPNAAAASASSVTGQGTTSRTGAALSLSNAQAPYTSTAIVGGVSSSKSSVTAVIYAVANESFVGLRPFMAVQAMSAWSGTAYSFAGVSGAMAQVIVRSGTASAGALVTGRNASLGGQEAWTSFRPFFALQGSTAPVPWGLSTSTASVSGEGVYSILGDYATPPRAVFDIPPPADFKPPGLTLDYGLATPLRLPGTTYAEITAGAAVSGQLRAVVIATAGSQSQSVVSGDARQAVAASGAATAGALVTGAPLGVIALTGTGSATSLLAVTGQDRSLSPGAGLGIATATSSVTATGPSSFVQPAAAVSQSNVQAVDASGYPLAAPAGNALAGAMASGEAVAGIIRTAEAHCAAAIAGMQATLAVAEAAVSSLADVTGSYGSFTTVVAAGRWPRDARTIGTTRAGTAPMRRPVNSS
jgi:hypothetical protein